MKHQWANDEEAALHGLPMLAQLLYLRCLRRHMDYATGKVGEHRKISYQMFSEYLEVTPPTHSPHGNSPVRPTRDELRWALQQLQSAGLIEQINKGRFKLMIFKLPLAVTDLTGFGEVPHEYPMGSTPCGKVVHIYKNNQEVIHRSVHSTESAKRPIPPILPNTTTTIAQDEQNTPKGEAYTSTMQWAGFFGRLPEPFSLEQANKPKARAMYETWIERCITTDLVAKAVALGNQTLGYKPDNPTYYRNFVESIHRSEAGTGGGHGTARQLSGKGGSREFEKWYQEVEASIEREAQTDGQ